MISAGSAALAYFIPAQRCWPRAPLARAPPPRGPRTPHASALLPARSSGSNLPLTWAERRRLQRDTTSRSSAVVQVSWARQTQAAEGASGRPTCPGGWGRTSHDPSSHQTRESTSLETISKASSSPTFRCFLRNQKNALLFSQHVSNFSVPEKNNLDSPTPPAPQISSRNLRRGGFPVP